MGVLSFAELGTPCTHLCQVGWPGGKAVDVQIYRLNFYRIGWPGRLSLFVGTSAGLENPPMPHLVVVYRPALTALWLIYWAVQPDRQISEVDPLQLITYIPS